MIISKLTWISLCKTSFILELIKWLVPFLLSVTVFLRSIAESNRAKRESSSRARQQYNSDIRKWATECTELMSELTELFRNEPDATHSRISQLRWRISSKAFEGRFFFPNSRMSGNSRGLRPRVLDWLIYAYDVTEVARRGGDTGVSEVLFELERGFALDMQLVLDPANLESSLQELQARLQADDGYMEYSQRHPMLLQAKTWLDEHR